MRNSRAATIAGITATLLAIGGFGAPGALAGPVAEHFNQRGAAGVSTEPLLTGPGAVGKVIGAKAPSTGQGGLYLVYYPANMATDGYKNPIITYGNGTLGTCLEGVPFFSSPQSVVTHLASWGYVVVCSNTFETGLGREIWEAAQDMVAENSKPSSRFFGQLDTERIGAVGTSQGASGVVNASKLARGTIKSIVPISHVNPELGGVSTAGITTPMFLVGATADSWATPEVQQKYFDDAAGPAAKALVVGGGHGAVGLGYVTAWLKYTLDGDTGFARTAFAGASPELASDPAWTGFMAKDLP